jgi:hypothetical protein
LSLQELEEEEDLEAEEEIALELEEAGAGARVFYLMEGALQMIQGVEAARIQVRETLVIYRVEEMVQLVQLVQAAWVVALGEMEVQEQAIVEAVAVALEGGMEVTQDLD